MPASPSSKSKKALASLSKSELLDRVAALPCAPNLTAEDCPAERLRIALSTHQVELEAQNQELRESQLRTEEARDRYSDLYDFAPVGYVTLDPRGCVREINLTGAAMLGEARKQLIGMTLLPWLNPECRGIFQRHLKQVFAGGARVVDELLLRGDENAPRHINLASIVVDQGTEAGRECRTIMADITLLKEKESKLTHSRQQLRGLSAHLDQVREDERLHLAREIHDELGQKLTALRFEVAMLGMKTHPAHIALVATSLLRQVDETIESVRAIASDLRPAVLDLGLVAVIEWQLRQFGKRTGIKYVLNVSDEEITLDNARATAIFRIVQESLTNIVRHAAASKVVVTLSKLGSNLRLQVEDNGIGLSADAQSKPSSFGLVGMRERALLLEGTLEISGKPGQGTKLELSVPS
ncbi:MAG: histidine kinase [Pseudomonadota bacterium]|nr:histidine kinase [Pseudomonadota bacterium]MDP1906227.1 histidine kinase [Pseudomonadota bacterium]MDP2352316.1 histidine kinase [Pseudomonadota bacterium]